MASQNKKIKDNYSEMEVSDLKVECANKDLPGYSKLTKKQLISYLRTGKRPAGSKKKSASSSSSSRKKKDMSITNKILIGVGTAMTFFTGLYLWNQKGGTKA